MIPFLRVIFSPTDLARAEGWGIGIGLSVCSLLLVVGVTVGRLERIRGMRIVAFPRLWSRNA